MLRLTKLLPLWLVLACQPLHGDHAELPAGVTPVMATWLWGYHTVPGTVMVDDAPRLYAYPHTDAARINDPPWSEVARTHIKPGARAPAVLLMHGCAGIVRGAVGHRAYLLSRGYAIFEPDSLARPGRAPCRPGGYSGTAFTREAISRLRYAEIAYALAQIAELPWVDRDRVILMGISEGGWAVSRWEKPGFVAHVIVSAACVAADRRPLAPGDVAVLAMAGAEDGHSCVVTRTIGGSRSLVIAGAPHAIMNRREVRDALDRFLRECCP